MEHRLPFAVELVADIGTRMSVVPHVNIVELGEIAVFAHGTPEHGMELWQSNGTKTGTGLLKDLRPGPASSNPDQLVVFDGRVYFTAKSDDAGVELWTTDGTAEGTFIVRDINPGLASSNPNSLTVVGDRLMFQAFHEELGREVWKSDGTSEGTKVVTEIVPGVGRSLLDEFTAVGETLYFSAYHPSYGTELWRSDGTESGTGIVRDLIAGTYNTSPKQFTAAGDRLFFVTTTVDHGTQLWVSDGTSAGTVPVLQAPRTESFSEITAGGNDVYFRAHHTDLGFELWKSDGTLGGTVLVKDINPGPSSSNPRELVWMNGGLNFLALNGELWRSDGTEQGTVRVPLMNQPRVTQLHEYHGELYLHLYDALSGLNTLWRSDGMTANITYVGRLDPSLWESRLITLNEKALLNLVTPGVRRVVISSDTTNEFSDLTTSQVVTTASSLPNNLTVIDDRLVFIASGSDGRKLFHLEDNGNLSSSIDVSGFDVTVVNERAYFTSTTVKEGNEPWVTDGTSGGTHLLFDVVSGPDSSDARVIGGIDDWLLLSTPDNSLWRGSATSSSALQRLTEVEGTIVSSTVAGTTLFLAVRSRDGQYWLWRTDGTIAGTFFLKELSDRITPSFAWYSHDGRLFFRGFDEQSGLELWQTDGTIAGTQLVEDLVPGPGSSMPWSFASVGHELFYAGYEPGTGTELRKVRPDYHGSTLVADIFPGMKSSHVGSMVTFADSLYFAATDGEHGVELWKSRGSSDTTVLVKDIRPGPNASDVRQLTVVGDWLFFQADDGIHGLEPWYSDGTAGGTAMVADIHDFGGSHPLEFSGLGNRLYFSADHATVGWELWSLELDDDQDGVLNVIEDGAPFSGDGNQDGVADRLQDSVVSLRAGETGTYITLSAEPGASFETVRALDRTHGTYLPSGIDFAAGFLDIALQRQQATISGTTTIRARTHGEAFNTAFVADVSSTNSSWLRLPVHGVRDSTIDLLLEDGGRGDSLSDRSRIRTTVGLGADQRSARWQSAFDPSDVNEDGMTSSVDLLLIFNELNRNGSRPLSTDISPPIGQLWDASGDGFITPFDALLVINVINDKVASEQFIANADLDPSSAAVDLLAASGESALAGLAAAVQASAERRSVLEFDAGGLMESLDEIFGEKTDWLYRSSR